MNIFPNEIAFRQGRAAFLTGMKLHMNIYVGVEDVNFSSNRYHSWNYGFLLAQYETELDVRSEIEKLKHK